MVTAKSNKCCIAIAFVTYTFALLSFSKSILAATLSIPGNNPANLAVWPNLVSRANSDHWLANNHDSIRLMKPRLLVLNFSNQVRRDHLDRMLDALITALAEGSRYR